jgi:hypothetical protein
VPAAFGIVHVSCTSPLGDGIGIRFSHAGAPSIITASRASPGSGATSSKCHSRTETSAPAGIRDVLGWRTLSQSHSPVATSSPTCPPKSSCRTPGA